ncbi:response regulator [Iodobacter ciconiae]|uniref:Response regulator transcription factor n=1 Tax=Iodobacter ciconiae TaxID=2496266 RepID=A0A3S8ZND5_9NEIS|nr:response regulator transcription factor [Iodobacter ciconiae]AZN35077.1 response regulator transcription factor [Iodobacter ciconiae]
MSRQLLLIDDDERLTAMLAEYLRQQGFAVEVAHDGKRGLAALASRSFDALILDLMLPDADGLDLCRQIRQTQALPILMLTARGDVTDRIVGLELGADDYLAKPFDARELLARLRAILRRQHSTESSSPLTFGNIEIDADARSVLVAGQACSITSYQFDLLLCLARHAGKVLSREQILDQVRGETLEAFDRSIDVHISKLRAALGDDSKAPKRIITVRSVGYVFAKTDD